MSPAIPELHVAVAQAKHELDRHRNAGDELASALAEDRLNTALDELSRALAARKRPGKASTPPNGRTALTSSGGGA